MPKGDYKPKSVTAPELKRLKEIMVLTSSWYRKKRVVKGIDGFYGGWVF